MSILRPPLTSEQDLETLVGLAPHKNLSSLLDPYPGPVERNDRTGESSDGETDPSTFGGSSSRPLWRRVGTVTGETHNLANTRIKKHVTVVPI